MNDTYKDFQLEPSKPHQCMHESEKDGARCRAIAMHNELMCYQHRSRDIPTVIENDPFLIPSLDDRAAIQKALGDLAARLACNHIEFQRASLLLQSLQTAMYNLPPHPRPAPPDAGAPGPSHLGTRDSAATQPATGNLQPPPLPERAYTQEERDHFKYTVFAHGYEPNPKYPRPASLTDEDIQAHTAARRREFHFSPLTPRKDGAGRLISLHELGARYTIPAPTAEPLPANATPPAVILSEEHRDESKDPEALNPAPTSDPIPPPLHIPNSQPTTNNEQPATLPQLLAVACASVSSGSSSAGIPTAESTRRGNHLSRRRSAGNSTSLVVTTPITIPSAIGANPPHTGTSHAGRCRSTIATGPSTDTCHRARNPARSPVEKASAPSGSPPVQQLLRRRM